MKDLFYTYDNIDDFYHDALNPELEGDLNRFKGHLLDDDSRFRGLPLDEIKISKYNYQKGLDELENIDIDIDLGGSSRKYVYDENDGDDMNFDRMLDGFPCLLKRIKTSGIGSGRMINVYVVISENCNIGYSQMLNKAYTAISIVDMLESLGYRVAIYACANSTDLWGSYKNEHSVHYKLEVCLKKHEDSLNKGLILTGISPWFFRYYMFAHQMGHYNCGGGLGSATKLQLPQTKENILIDSGECLTKESSAEKIKDIEKLFSAQQRMTTRMWIRYIIILKGMTIILFKSYGKQ